MNKKMMKKLFTIALVGVFALSACAQKKAEEKKEISYTVSGTCPAGVKKVMIVDPLKSQQQAAITLDVANGKFTYTGKALEETFFSISTGEEAPVTTTDLLSSLILIPVLSLENPMCVRPAACSLSACPI